MHSVLYFNQVNSWDFYFKFPTKKVTSWKHLFSVDTGDFTEQVYRIFALPKTILNYRQY